MRIVAGTAKGTRLAPVPPGTRPLSDRAREGLFSSLGAEVADARCADLYAGTGAVGIEALSRGAASCLFVDSSAEATRTIEENLARTHLEERGTVLRSDVERALAREKGHFDLAFLDPPYETPPARLGDILKLADARIAPDGVFVLTRPARDANDVVPIHWEIARLLRYGDALILVCRRRT